MMICQRRVRSGFMKNTPIAAGQRLGFFLRFCTSSSLPQHNNTTTKVVSPKEAKSNNIKQSETSKPEKREPEKRSCGVINPAPNPGLYLHEIPYPKTQPSPLPRKTWGKTERTPPSVGPIPPKKSEVKKAVQRILPSIVTITLSTATSKKMYGGIIVDPLGYIITSAEDMDSQKKEDLSKFKVDVHLNPGMPSEYTLAGEVSYVDLVNKLAIVKCKSDKALEKMSAKLNLLDHCGKFSLYVSTTCGHNNSFPNSLYADLVKITGSENTRPFPLEKVKSCVFSSSTEQEKLYGLAIVNLDGELVGLVKDTVNLCATSAGVISNVLNTAKELGNCQPWIGVDLFPLIIGSSHQYMVRSVVPNSPAAVGGICIGDVIDEVGMEDILSFVELYNMLLLYCQCEMPVHVVLSSKVGGLIKHATVVPQWKGQARDPFI